MEPSQSARSSIDTPRPSGPIPLFDHHLKILSDSYLSFFLERRRVEEVYTESLVKLQKKIKSIDLFLDDRSEISTIRSAWGDIRDNLEREAQARHAFTNTLTDDVIKPLIAIKETQERTRKRIKEDWKESTQTYHEYSEVTLPKLKARYLKKYAEVEESKTSFTAMPISPLQSPTVEHPPSSKPSVPASSRPTVTSPQPLRALDRRPSGSAPRNRSPSSNTAFSDLAHQGKRQLNSLMTFLDKGGSMKEGLGGRENTALRAVRAKRELDEADKEYRKGVHWLETLRLRQTKTLESGYKSLVMFVEEVSGTVKKCLVKYTDNLTATSATEMQLSTHARSVVERISPEKDVSRVSASIPRSLASAIPDPVLYQHGQVGECNDLIFGLSLVDYATTKNLPEGEIPRIVKLCIQEIENRGIDSEGIYRVSGRHAIVHELQHEIEKDEETFQFSKREDVYVIASLLKMYLRELPEPVFKYPLQDRIQHTEDIAEHQTNNFPLLRSKMRRLPAVHQATLKALVEHLARVAAHSEKNKMDPKNLAIVFGGVIFGEDEIPKGGDLLNIQTWKDSMMEDLITNAKVLFDEQNSGSTEPPLPPTPAGEPAPHYSYGSKTTKIASVPPTPTSSGLAPPDDFTPRLPPRPTNSIHPSARNPSSPTKEHFTVPAPPPLPTRPREKAEDATPPSPSVTSSVFETDASNDGDASPLLEQASQAHAKVSTPSTEATTKDATS